MAGRTGPAGRKGVRPGPPVTWVTREGPSAGASLVSPPPEGSALGPGAVWVPFLQRSWESFQDKQPWAPGVLGVAWFPGF